MSDIPSDASSLHSSLHSSSSKRRRRSRVREFFRFGSNRRNSSISDIAAPSTPDRRDSVSSLNTITPERRAETPAHSLPTQAQRQRPVSELITSSSAEAASTTAAPTEAPTLPSVPISQPLASVDLPSSSDRTPEVQQPALSEQSQRTADSAAPPRQPSPKQISQEPLHVPRSRMAAAVVTNGHARAPAAREITIIHDALPKFEKKVKGLHTSLSQSGTSGPTRISIEDFLDYVMAERLRRIPHQGGRWDRVLKWAEHFTSQVSLFEQCVHGFLTSSLEASQVVYLACRALLEMGPSQAHALERAFRVLYEESVVLSFFIRHQNMFDVSEVRPELAHAYVSLITLVVDIAVYYNRRTSSTKSSTVVVNFYSLFGRTIQSFFRRKDNVANAMWTHQLRESPETQYMTTEIATIRGWLGAHGSGLPVSISNPKSERAEFSCEWFQTYLADFIRSKDDVLSIEGPSGSGKSVLASWIIERLQRPLNRRYIEPISYFLDANIPSQSTPLNLVKGLLVQLLEKHVGDVELYKGLVSVYELSSRSGTSFEIEEALWEVLDHAVKSANDLVIIVDGVNEANGSQDSPVRVFERLHSLASKYFGVRAITGSQSAPKSYSKTKHFTITPEHTHQDVFNLARHFLTTRGHIHEDDQELDKAAEKIAAKSKGSFVTANLLLYLLARETSKEAMLQTIDKAQNIDSILTILIESAVKKPAVKQVLSWLLIAQNNLTVDDLRVLLEVDPTSGSRTTYPGDIREDLIRECDSLIVIQDGLVRFRHLSISEHLRHLATSGKALVPAPEAHQDFLNRILLHIKLSLTRDEQPGTEELEPVMVDELYHDVPLLQYVVSHWTAHFKHTSMWKDNGSYTYTAEFKRVFPTVAIFPLLEKTTWETAFSLTEVSTLHLLALTIRESVLGKNEPSVLQSYLNLATTYQKTGNTTAATQYYYSAFTISRTVLGVHSSLTAFFATTYLNLVSSIKSTKRDTTVTHKEETLKYLIAHSKHEHEESEAVLQYKKQLADMYMAIQETSSASVIYREVYESTVQRYGVSSKETTEVSRDLTTVLEKEKKRDEIAQYTRPVFEVAETTMAVDDSRRVAATIQMADTYESQKDFAKAEELYVMMWQRLAEHSTKVNTKESHVQVIDAVLAYVRFLRRNGRKSEAESTLIGLSSEYQSREIKSDVVASKLTVVGRELRELGVASVAVSIFASLWSYFKQTNRQSSKEAADVAIQLTNTAKDVPDQASTKSYTSVLMEVFQASFSSNKSIQIDATTIHTCQTLSAYHVQSEHWAEAAEICAKLLVSLWPSLSNFKSPERFPEEYAKEATEIAVREAHCRYKLSQLERAEKLYLYIFRAAKSTMKIDDERVTELVRAIITFFTTTNQTEKLTAFYEELLVSYRKTLGAANKTTIATLYSLANIYVRTNQKRAIELYSEILTALNQNSKVCHHDALDAAIALSTIYYETRTWKSAESVFALLWITVTQKSKEYSLREDFVQNVYQKYVQVLKTETKVDYATLRKLAIEYREVAVSTFGASSEVAIQATLTLAEINSQESKHQQEAISLYEETFKHTEKSTTKNAGLLALMAAARKNLSHLYISNATTNSANTEKATTLYKEQYETSKARYGYSHHTTLDSIRGLVLLWTKSKSTEQTTAATRELQTSTVSILNTERDSKTLYDSANTLAETYISAGLVERGLELLQELKRQIVFRDYSKSSTTGIKVTENVDRSSFIFLSTFEEALHQRKTSFSIIMTELLTETVLYQQYRQHVQKNTRIDLILLAGARLRAFLLQRKRLDQVKIIEDECFELFLKALASEIKTDREITRRFFIVMLEELSKERHSAHLGNAACNGGNSRVLTHLKEGKFTEAYELGLCVFQFVHAHRGYHHAGNIGSGFKLSLYMAGRGVPRPTDEKLRAQMLELSRSILKDTLDACKTLKLEFVAMQLTELNDLVALMGEQKNYTDLEWLLEQLWNSRHSQVSWKPSTVVSIGRRLIECRFAHGQRDSAIHLCQDVVYNLRHVWGPLDKTTIEISDLLSKLLTTAGRHAEAMAVHEGILREEVGGDNDEPVNAETAGLARNQLDLLRLAHARLGKFNKDETLYQELFQQVSTVFGKEKAFEGASNPRSWSGKDNKALAGDTKGTFVAPTTWEIAVEEASAKRHSNFMHKRRSSGMNILLNGGLQSPVSNKTVAA